MNEKRKFLRNRVGHVPVVSKEIDIFEIYDSIAIVSTILKPKYLKWYKKCGKVRHVDIKVQQVSTKYTSKYYIA